MSGRRRTGCSPCCGGLPDRRRCSGIDPLFLSENDADLGGPEKTVLDHVCEGIRESANEAPGQTLLG